MVLVPALHLCGHTMLAKSLSFLGLSVLIFKIGYCNQIWDSQKLLCRPHGLMDALRNRVPGQLHLETPCTAYTFWRIMIGHQYIKSEHVVK